MSTTISLVSVLLFIYGLVQLVYSRKLEILGIEKDERIAKYRIDAHSRNEEYRIDKGTYPPGSTTLVSG